MYVNLCVLGSCVFVCVCVCAKHNAKGTAKGSAVWKPHSLQP